jgi:hypothetical protein
MSTRHEVTGITDWKDGAVLAEFLWDFRWREATPKFLEFAGKVYPVKRTGKAYFRKYDDGWRIQE